MWHKRYSHHTLALIVHNTAESSTHNSSLRRLAARYYHEEQGTIFPKSEIRPLEATGTHLLSLFQWKREGTTRAVRRTAAVSRPPASSPPSWRSAAASARRAAPGGCRFSPGKPSTSPCSTSPHGSAFITWVGISLFQPTVFGQQFLSLV